MQQFKEHLVPNFHSSVVDAEATLEWEVRKDNIPFKVHCIAGACAGIVEHSFMYPLDTLKTRIQSQSITTKYRNIFKVYSYWSQYDHFKTLFRGLPAICLGSVPAHAAYFSTYEMIKSKYGIESSLNSAVCGAVSVMSHDIVITPVDVIKQRLQMGCYKNTFNCIQSIFQKEGLSGFYRSLHVTLFMNIPFGAIFFLVNECCKKKLIYTADTSEDFNLLINKIPSKLESLLPYFISAGIAGGAAGALTTPLDVIKTNIQVEPLEYSNQVNSIKYYSQENYKINLPTDNAFRNKINNSNINSNLGLYEQNYRFKFGNSAFKTFYLVKRLYRKNGLKGFFRGGFFRIILCMPSTAICWGTYETVKQYLI